MSDQTKAMLDVLAFIVALFGVPLAMVTLLCGTGERP
jgi:hypothetical protein